MEGFLVMLAFFLLSGLANWIQKKQREQKEAEEEWEMQHRPAPGPGPSRPTVPPLMRPSTDEPQRPKMDWERELRRLLNPDEETAGPKPLSPPPPLIIRKEPPPSVSRPVARTVLQTPPAILADEEGPASSNLLVESSQAYARAQQLHEAALARVQRAVERTVQHKPRKRTSGNQMTPSDLSAVVSMLGHPQTVRQGFVFSTILGTPKALEGEASSPR